MCSSDLITNLKNWLHAHGAKFGLSFKGIEAARKADAIRRGKTFWELPARGRFLILVGRLPEIQEGYQWDSIFPLNLKPNELEQESPPMRTNLDIFAQPPISTSDSAASFTLDRPISTTPGVTCTPPLDMACTPPLGDFHPISVFAEQESKNNNNPQPPLVPRGVVVVEGEKFGLGWEPHTHAEVFDWIVNHIKADPAPFEGSGLTILTSQYQIAWVYHALRLAFSAKAKNPHSYATSIMQEWQRRWEEDRREGRKPSNQPWIDYARRPSAQPAADRPTEYHRADPNRPLKFRKDGGYGPIRTAGGA